MRILVIGGCGFIGSHIVEALALRHDEVVVFDRASSKFEEGSPSAQYVRGELGNRGELETVIASGFDVVIHLVSSTIPQTSNDDPIFDVQMNLVESLALFDLCVKRHVRKLVFISSGGTVYGIPNTLPVPEDHPTDPICSYGIVKLAIEKYLQFYHRLYGLEYVILRVSNPYGIRQDPIGAQGVVPVFIWKIICGEQIKVWGDGSVVRDFISVRDVARLCGDVVRGTTSGTFNVGSGNGTSINELLTLMGEVLGLKPSVQRLEHRKFDVPSIILDCSRARTAFGWTPAVPLAEGLYDLSQWLMNRRSASKKRGNVA